MPHGDDPDRLSLHSVEKAVRRHDYFPVRKIRILGNRSSGFREPGKPSQNGFCAAAKSRRGARIRLADICERGKELGASGRGEEDLHRSVFRKKRIRFCQDRLQTVSLSCRNLFIPACQEM